MKFKDWDGHEHGHGHGRAKSTFFFQLIIYRNNNPNGWFKEQRVNLCTGHKGLTFAIYFTLL